MKRSATLLLSAAVILSACEAIPATIMTQNRPQPRPLSALLTPEQRASLQERFDVDALDELLALMDSTEQRQTLAGMGVRLPGQEPPTETTDVIMPFRSSDPVRQALIERVWAPMWDHWPAEYLDRTDLPFPGRELARARRAAREEAKKKEGRQ